MQQTMCRKLLVHRNAMSVVEGKERIDDVVNEVFGLPEPDHLQNKDGLHIFTACGLPLCSLVSSIFHRFLHVLRCHGPLAWPPCITGSSLFPLTDI